MCFDGVTYATIKTRGATCMRLAKARCFCCWQEAATVRDGGVVAWSRRGGRARGGRARGGRARGGSNRGGERREKERREKKRREQKRREQKRRSWWSLHPLNAIKRAGQQQGSSRVAGTCPHPAVHVIMSKNHAHAATRALRRHSATSHVRPAWAPHGLRMGSAWARMGSHGLAWARMGVFLLDPGPFGPAPGLLRSP